MSTGMKCKIYGLVDLNNPTCIRYIGQTQMELSRRLTLHKYQSGTTMAKTPVGKWIRSKEKNVGIVLVDGDAIWNWSEIEYIRKLKTSCQLLNLSDGGQGRLNFKLSDEHKAKISRSLRGLKPSLETRQKISKAKTGFSRMSENNKRAIIAANIGRTPPNKGEKLTTEQRDLVAKAKGSDSFSVVCKGTGKLIGTWSNKKRCAEEIGLSNTGVHLGLRKGFVKNFEFVGGVVEQ